MAQLLSHKGLYIQHNLLSWILERVLVRKRADFCKYLPGNKQDKYKQLLLGEAGILI